MLLFSINNPYKIQSFFKNFQVSDCTYLAVTSLRRNMFDFEEYIPLETVMQLTGIFLKNPHHKEKILEDKELYDLYKIYDYLLYNVLKALPYSNCTNTDSQNYKIFDGITEININRQTILFYPNLVKTYNKEMAQGRKLVFPNSLKKLNIIVDNITYDGDFLEHYEFELNEGLESLIISESLAFAKPPKVLELPTTLEDFMITIKPETIRFRNYTNSKLINTKSKFIKFLKELKYVQKIPTTDSYIKNLEFKGKSSFTTFSFDAELLAYLQNIDYETIYKVFQKKIKEMYEKLYEVVQAFELEIPKEEANFDNLKKLEVELFKDLLIDYLKNFVIYIYKDKELSKKIEEIIEKHRGDYSYFEYLLRNPFLLKLKLSIEDPNYHDTMLDVFKKHKVKTPKEIMDRVKTKNQEDCISYLKLMEIIIKNGNSSTPSKSNFTSNPYLDDLSLIYKAAKSKLYNYNFVINYELEECETFELDASESKKLIRKK